MFMHVFNVHIAKALSSCFHLQVCLWPPGGANFHYGLNCVCAATDTLWVQLPGEEGTWR